MTLIIYHWSIEAATWCTRKYALEAPSLDKKLAVLILMKMRFWHLAETHLNKHSTMRLKTKEKSPSLAKHIAGSNAKQVDYTEPFIFYSAAKACITWSESKRAKALKPLDECLSEWFQEFSADSILNKLLWINKST